MPDNQELLAEYAQTQSDQAFRELVTRYIGLVYSAALRLSNGNAQTAEDVTQIVFADLAHSARTLPREVMLGGWLHRHTCFVASNLMRSERRRLLREKAAAEMNGDPDHSEENLTFLKSILDEAIQQLGAADRTVILLRFFEQYDLRRVGEALGSNEDAARMRIHRALGKLENVLRRRGVALSGAALGSLLATECVAAVPSGMALTISTSALAAASQSSAGPLSTVLQVMASTKLKTSVATVILIASITAPLLVQRKAEARSREQDEALRRQAGAIAQLQTENQRLARQAAEVRLTREQAADLERLRAEVAALQQQAGAVTQLRTENQRLQKSLERPRTALEVKEEMVFRSTYTRHLTDALFRAAQQNKGEFPTSIEDAARLLPPSTNAAIVDLAPEQFEITFRGNLNAVKQSASNVIVLREREAWRTGPLSDPKGRWAKYYGYADGSVRLRPQTESNFDEFERQHAAPAP